MKILGFTWNEFLIVAMFATTLVLFITLPISQTNDSTLGESIFGQHRTPKGKKRKVKSESDWKKYYGSCPELKEEIKKYGRENFKGLSSLFIRHLAKQILKKRANCFSQRAYGVFTTEPLPTTIAIFSSSTSKKIIMDH